MAGNVMMQGVNALRPPQGLPEASCTGPGATGARAGRQVFWGLGLAALLAGGCGAVPQETPAPTQPMPFNHAVHVEEDLACLDCHNQADKGPYAATVTIDGCMKCHAEAKEDEKPVLTQLRELHAGGREIAWRWVNRLPGHVYFPHEPHVVYGEVPCQECHGAVEKATEAFTTSQVEHLTMAKCIACHEERQVVTDCVACHK